MAQGFVANLNLQESITTPSDRAILDNLGGIDITSDILLFDGNSKFASVLRNNQQEVKPTEVFFGDFDTSKSYKIVELGSDHDWVALGATSATVGQVFTPSSDGSSDTGSGGFAKEVFVRSDFEGFYDNNSNNGYSIRVVGVNKIAFSTDTVFAISAVGESSTLDYPYKSYNSNGEDVFQIISASDVADPPTILNIDTILSGIAGADINNVTFTRSDTITSDNISNMKVQKISTDDEAEGGGSISLGEEGGGDGDEETEGLTPLEKIAFIGNIVAKVKYKKSRVPVNFLDNNFDVRFRLNGLMQINNDSSLEIGYPRGVNTALIQGTEYKIIDKGDTPDSYFNGVSGLSQVWSNDDTFTAVNVGSGSSNGTASIKATKPPGLFILNAGNKIRAFSGSDNPWTEVASGSTPAFITGGALRSEPSTNIAQVKDLVLKDLASPASTDVNFIKTNTAKTATASQVNTGDITIASYTHKLPINVNGEQFYILTQKQ